MKKYFRLKYLSSDHSIHASFNCVIHNSYYIIIKNISYIDIYTTFFTIDINNSIKHYINNEMIKKKNQQQQNPLKLDIFTKLKNKNKMHW